MSSKHQSRAAGAETMATPSEIFSNSGLAALSAVQILVRRLHTLLAKQANHHAQEPAADGVGCSTLLGYCLMSLGIQAQRGQHTTFIILPLRLKPSQYLRV